MCSNIIAITDYTRVRSFIRILLLSFTSKRSSKEINWWSIRKVKSYHSLGLLRPQQASQKTNKLHARPCYNLVEKVLLMYCKIVEAGQYVFHVSQLKI
jgi:hypothetical protein